MKLLLPLGAIASLFCESV